MEQKELSPKKDYNLREKKIVQLTDEGLIPINSRIRGCRNCQNFLRIGFKKNKEVRKRGFCILGGNCFLEKGDFSPFVSSSVSDYCASFVLDLNKLKITKWEDDFESRMNNYAYKSADKRVKQIRRALKKDKKKSDFIGEMFLQGEIEQEERRKFRMNNFEEWMKLSETYDISEKDWSNLMDTIVLGIKHRCTNEGVKDDWGF